MSVRLRLLITGLAALGISSAAIAKPITLSTLQGQWRVYKSELADPEGVHAYGDDQLRAIVGNGLLISRDSVRWVISHDKTALSEHTSFSDRCARPAILDKGHGHFDIHCEGGDGLFAPGFRMLRNGNLQIGWWDGLVVYLRKQK